MLSPPLPNLYAGPAVALCRQLGGRLWQNAGKTTPAVADGDTLAVITCPFTGVDFAVTAGVLNGSGGAWWCTFNGSTTKITFPGLNSSPLSAHFAFRPAPGGGSSYVGCAAAAGGQKFKLIDGQMKGGKEGVYNWAAGNTTIAMNTDYVGGLDYGATGAAVYWLNGATDGTADADVADNSPGAPLSAAVKVTTIGQSTGGGEQLKGRLYGWCLYTAHQTNADIAGGIHPYLAAAISGDFGLARGGVYRRPQWSGTRTGGRAPVSGSRTFARSLPSGKRIARWPGGKRD